MMVDTYDYGPFGRYRGVTLDPDEEEYILEEPSGWWPRMLWGEGAEDWPSLLDIPTGGVEGGSYAWGPFGRYPGIVLGSDGEYVEDYDRGVEDLHAALEYYTWLMGDPGRITNTALDNLEGSTRIEDEWGVPGVNWRGQDYYATEPGFGTDDIIGLAGTGA